MGNVVRDVRFSVKRKEGSWLWSSKDVEEFLEKHGASLDVFITQALETDERIEDLDNKVMQLKYELEKLQKIENMIKRL